MRYDARLPVETLKGHSLSERSWASASVHPIPTPNFTSSESLGGGGIVEMEGRREGGEVDCEQNRNEEGRRAERIEVERGEW